MIRFFLLLHTLGRTCVWLIVFLAAVSQPGLAAPTGPGTAAIASAHPQATAAGREILNQGGNAFDAAVAIAAVLAVVEPAGSGLGGGGFWLLHRAHDGFEVMVDARERAPLAAHADMYLDKAGQPVPGLSLDGPLAAAIPGTPAAFVHIAERYGRLSLNNSLAPARRLARRGFLVTERYQRLAGWRLRALQASPAAAQVFLDGGAVPAEGYRVKQPDLARVLKQIAKHGRAGFYAGRTAKQLVDGVRAAGGIWSLEDLAAYHVIERVPVTGTYRGVRITSAALPSSGGIVLMQILNMLQGEALERLPSASRYHLLVEVMRRAYRDRALYLGDPDFVAVDTVRLLDQGYAARLRASINASQATPSDTLSAPQGEGTQTTHFSVMDAEGNRVAVTLTINYPFGSCFMPPQTGILLNNEMDDFVVKPGVPNAYGLVGGQANAIAPGKTPLSSMTPTFLESPEAVVILGTPGGSRIITMVLLVTLEFIEGRGGPQDWVALPRFHHQYLPDTVVYEPGAFSAADLQALRELGHELKAREHPYGNMQIVFWDKRGNQIDAASDPRGEGLAWAEP